MREKFGSFNNLDATNRDSSSLSRTLENMAHHYAVAVDGASINKMRRIDREFKKYEESQLGRQNKR